MELADRTLQNYSAHQVSKDNLTDSRLNYVDQLLIVDGSRCTSLSLNLSPCSTIGRDLILTTVNFIHIILPRALACLDTNVVLETDHSI